MVTNPYLLKGSAEEIGCRRLNDMTECAIAMGIVMLIIMLMGVLT